jgi:membrane protease subunit HflC
VIRGEGDAERNRLYAEAYSRDPEFFDFYRSMTAYEAALKSKDTRLVLSPDSDFFRYFTDPLGGAASLPAPAAPTPGKPSGEVSGEPTEPSEAASAAPVPPSEGEQKGTSPTAQ